MKHIILLIGALLFISCQQQSKDFVVKGNIEGAENEWIYLNRLELRNKVLVDSARTNSEGDFELSGAAGLPDFYTLEKGNNGSINLAIYPGEEITVNTKTNSFGNPYIVYGSVDSERINKLVTRQREMFTELKDNFMQFKDSLGSPNIEALLIIRDQRRDSIIDEFADFTRSFIESNPESFASLLALYQNIGPNRTVLGTESDMKYYKMVDSALMQKFPSADPVKSLNRLIVQVENMKNAPEKGQIAPNFALPTPNGDTLLLSDLEGQYVLLDFWASWCGPCRRENPVLVDAHEQYKDKNFTILQVSLDKKKNEWVKGIENDSLNWYHVSDLKFWESPVAAMYNVKSIPSNFLLNPDREIIAINLKGQALKEELEKVLN